MPRNEHVEKAVDALLLAVDAHLTTQSARLPALNSRMTEIIEEITSHESASVRLALAFLVFYSLEDPSWDFRRVPTGTRGQYGDKRLSEELTRRRITFHSSIVAFGENLGWKGNVRQFDLAGDPRVSSPLKKISELSKNDRRALANHLAFRIAETRSSPKPIPPLDSKVLSFARARVLFDRLLAVPSLGHVQQFLVAALLFVHRRRLGLSIITHHPHAADRFDSAAGDIEERKDDVLLRAYEVTVRPDWKNRLAGFRQKMERFHLAKYVIIASDISNDPQLRESPEMLRFLEPTGKDLAVLAIDEFCRFMAMELTAEELREAINKTNDYLLSHDLCGVPEYQAAFFSLVSEWIAETAS